jgi:biopolymer transport protein TolR
MAEINVVPYIDVMLVLLIIFMVAAPLINPGQIDLPQAARSSIPPWRRSKCAVRANGDLASSTATRRRDELRVTRARSSSSSCARRSRATPSRPW